MSWKALLLAATIGLSAAQGAMAQDRRDQAGWRQERGWGEGHGRPPASFPRRDGGWRGREPEGRPPANYPPRERAYPPAFPPGFAGPPPSDWRAQQDEAREAVRQGRHVPLGRVIESIRGRTPGRQLDTGLERGADGRPIYRVRWAAGNGRRIDYIVDAETGEILAAEGR